jgi:acetoin:2,6-dichlorophenolindophenol oxidoreductase subunit alpha
MLEGSARAGREVAMQNDMQARKANDRRPMISISAERLKFAAGGHGCDDPRRVAALNKETLLDLYSRMKLIREFEEHARDLYSRAVIGGILHLSVGQEAVAAGVCAALGRDDYITSTHRGHGHCLAKGGEPKRMFAELFGKIDGYCRGKGGSMHIADPQAGNLGANAIVGGSIPIATGAALSAQVRKTSQVAVCFFGDGALNQGVLFESMNLAAIWKLPVIYACENNQYGEYVTMKSVTAGNIEQRGQAFGIPSVVVDGMNILDVHKAASEAVARARRGDGPSFLVFDTYRYHGHGMSDRERPYRTREEENQWRTQRDPIDRFSRHLVEIGSASQSELDAIDSRIKADLASAIEFARQSPLPDSGEVTLHVFAD